MTHWYARPVLTLDLETTSADPHEAEIVQYALAKVTPSGRVLEAQAAVVQTREWSHEAQAVHRITRAESQAGLAQSEALDRIQLALSEGGGLPLVVFNASYDLTVLVTRAGVEHGSHDLQTPGVPLLTRTLDALHVLDPLVLDKHAHKYRRGKRNLGMMHAHYFGKAPSNQHDAMSDALAAARIAYAIAREHELIRRPAWELHALQATWAAEQAESLQAYFRRTNPGAVVDGSWPIKTKEEEEVNA